MSDPATGLGDRREINRSGGRPWANRREGIGMLELLMEPWTYPFMHRALLAATLAGVSCAVVGAFVVLKGMAFMGDAIAHSSLAGMAAAFLAGVNVFAGALAWAIPASLAMTWISRRANLRADTAIGIIFTGGFALGVILVSRVNNFFGDLFSFLFGNVLGASWGEIALMGGLAGLMALVIVAFYKELVFTTYDDDVAAAAGIPVGFFRYLLPLLVAITTVVSLKAVGIVLVLAMLITPASIALMLARRLPGIILTGVGAAMLSVLSGLYLSFYMDLPAGPAIVMTATFLFALTLAFSPRRGLLRRWLNRPGPAVAPEQPGSAMPERAAQ